MAGTEFPRLLPTGDSAPPTLPVPAAPINPVNPAMANPFQTAASTPDESVFKRFRPESTTQASPVGAPGGINAQS